MGESTNLSPVDITSQAISDIADRLHDVAVSKKQKLCKHVNYIFQHAGSDDCASCAEGSCFVRTCLDCAKEY